MRGPTLATGGLLVVLGVGAYAFSEGAKTALIPAFFGLPILLLGFLAARESLRMHVMHVAVLLALLGALGSLGRAIPAMAQGTAPSALALGSQLAMGVICVVYMVLAIRSFREARRAREGQ